MAKARRRSSLPPKLETLLVSVDGVVALVLSIWPIRSAVPTEMSSTITSVSVSGAVVVSGDELHGDEPQDAVAHVLQVVDQRLIRIVFDIPGLTEPVVTDHV